MKNTLTIFVKPPQAPGYRLPFPGDRLAIGRSATSDVRLPEDLSLSRHHAEIAKDGARVVVKDLGSRNGTFVNGQRVPAGGMDLSSGDTVSIGETLITLQERSPAGVEIGGDTPIESTGTLILSVEDVLGKGGRDRPDGSGPAGVATGLDPKLLARFSKVLAMFEAVSQTGGLPAEQEVEKLLGAILERIFELVPADRGAVVLNQGGRLVPVCSRYRDPTRASEPIQISRSMSDMVVQGRSAILTADAQVDPRFSEKSSIRLSGIRSAMCAPLWTGDAVLGLLYVDTLFAEMAFNREYLTLLAALANIAAMKVENQRLLAVYLEKERLERELDIAREICEALVPQGPPDIPGIELQFRIVPCRSIGGDLFDFVQADGAVHFLIADVCGKGIPAALLMAALQASFRAYVGIVEESTELVGRLNVTMFRGSPSNKYATAFYGRLDPATGSLRYVNAGHNAPLLMKKGGGMEELSTGGMVVGLFESAPYREGECRLERGDLLCLYTDGITEEEDPSGERVGSERLAAWLLEDIGRPLDQISTDTFARVDGFRQGGDRFDDRTLVFLRMA
ncbi:MAG: SpoIIE family protein phosphatase [Acidobacteriota bacterium]